MCMGGQQPTKVKMPKPAPLPPPLPPPAAPAPAPPPPKQLQEPGKAPDLRIGAAKKQTTTRSRTAQTGKGSQSLTIGSNQGMNL